MTKAIVEQCKNTTILAIDDEVKFLKRLERLLLYPGTFLKAQNGDEAIEIASKNKINLLLLDQNLETELGTDVLKEIKKINPGIKVILITICSEDEIRSQTDPNSENIKAYFQKPIKTRRYQRIRETVQELLLSSIYMTSEDEDVDPNVITVNSGYVEEFIDEYANVILYDEDDDEHQSILPRSVLENNAIYEGMNFTVKSVVENNKITTYFNRSPKSKETNDLIQNIMKDVDFDLGNDEW